MRQRLDRLREILYETPSPEAWQALCAVFDGWIEGVDVGLDYARGRLASWPEVVCLLELDTASPALSGVLSNVGSSLARCAIVTVRDFSALDGILAKAPLASLEGLHIHGRIGEPNAGITARQLAVIVGRCEVLTSLTLNHVQLFGQDVDDLLGSPLGHRLESLDISGNPLGPDKLRRLWRSESSFRLKRLALGRCGLGTDGFRALVRSSKLPALRDLSLRFNMLSPHCFTPSVLPSHSTLLGRLSSLDLSFNFVHNPVQSWCHLARLTPHLRRLDLRHTAATEDDIPALEALFKGCEVIASGDWVAS